MHAGNKISGALDDRKLLGPYIYAFRVTSAAMA
jgi:hypothetical protein